MEQLRPWPGPERERRRLQRDDVLSPHSIDLNADVGELPGRDGAAADAALMELVTSASVACGGHAGDEETMRRTCHAAVQHGVVIGAHIGYEDREHFGRRQVDVDAQGIAALAERQLAALLPIAAQTGARVLYVKPHGALYHRLTTDRAAAAAFVSACVGGSAVTAILGPPGSELLDAAGRAQLTPVAEGFADRRYATATALASRDRDDALLAPRAAATQAVAIATGKAIATDDGEASIAADSLCLHGDHGDAAATARAVRAALQDAAVDVRAFAR